MKPEPEDRATRMPRANAAGTRLGVNQTVNRRQTEP